MSLHGNLRKVLDCYALRLHEPPRGKSKNGRHGHAENAFVFVFKLRDWLPRDGAQGHRICAERYPDIDDTGRDILPQSPHSRDRRRYGGLQVGLNVYSEG